MELVIHGDAATAGDAWNTHGDVAMWSNPKVVEKTRKGLASIPLDGTVNIHFDELANPVIVCMDHKPFANKLAPGVNLFIRNNTGSVNRHNPLTPWILMHRLHHSFILGGRRLAGNDEVNRTVGLIAQCENELREVFGWSDECGEHGEAHLLTRAFSMRSARIKQLYPFVGDMAAELFAQFVITGDIKFRPAAEWDFDDGSNYKDSAVYHWSKKEGRFLHFYVGLGKHVMWDKIKQDRCDAILDKWKPVLLDSIKQDLELMKKMPNVI